MRNHQGTFSLLVCGVEALRDGRRSALSVCEKESDLARVCLEFRGRSS